MEETSQGISTKQNKRETDAKHNAKRTQNFRVGLVFFLFSFSLALLPQQGQAATLSVEPAAGNFTIGSTFNVSLFLNTEGQSVNTLSVLMSFSPDKLQLVSPSAGKSIIEIWTASPEFNNQTGRIKLQGGMPGGINVSKGLITTLTFRVKSVGPAIFKFLDDSRVLLNDGLGTDALKNTNSGVYQLTLPPPAGPIVSSQTHPNQGTWYSNPTVALGWVSEENVEGYSYILNKEPVDSLDNISDGQKTSIIYKNLSNGVYYFHIKSLRHGAWGGTTHFAVQIDTAPPAEFPVEIIPSSRTTRKQPVVQFTSTDAHSGIDHYELKVVPLTLKTQTDQPLFIEAQSPYVLSPLELGRYDVILRAYDKAGNYRESVKHLSIVTTAFQFIGEDGFEIRNVIFVPWFGFWTISIIILLLLIYGALHTKKWHKFVELRMGHKLLPREVQKQLEELKKYKSKYGPRSLVILVLILGSSLFAGNYAFSQQVEFAPPLIDTVSRNVSNEEIFYAGGKTDAAKAEIILYMQNLQTGETTSRTITSDINGSWFYRHDSFLPGGNYLLWAQSKVGDLLSPPSPQVQMTVRQTAIQFGSSRVSYETLYLIIVLILLAAVIGLAIYIIFHAYHGRKKHLRFTKEIKEAQESVRRGFAVLKRDIQSEFALIQKMKLEKVISEEEQAKELQLLKDLQEVERYIGKEIWDIEENEYIR